MIENRRASNFTAIDDHSTPCRSLSSMSLPSVSPLNGVHFSESCRAACNNYCRHMGCHSKEIISGNSQSNFSWLPPQFDTCDCCRDWLGFKQVSEWRCVSAYKSASWKIIAITRAWYLLVQNGSALFNLISKKKKKKNKEKWKALKMT